MLLGKDEPDERGPGGEQICRAYKALEQCRWGPQCKFEHVETIQGIQILINPKGNGTQNALPTAGAANQGDAQAAAQAAMAGQAWAGLGVGGGGPLALANASETKMTAVQKLGIVLSTSQALHRAPRTFFRASTRTRASRASACSSGLRMEI